MTSFFLSKSIAEVSGDILNKHISVTEIMEEALSRINSYDSRINSFITINSKALDAAGEADKQITAGHYKGPLHGIPIGLKDMIDTSDMKTTMGSEIFKDYIPSYDAAVVNQLKKAGAIIIGKQNTHQFAYGPTGDRSYYGPMRNPYDPSRMAGGSSGGSAASVAAGLCFAALGTDTSGSIRVPASFCGIVGMKPTNGRLVNQKGVFPLAQSLDSTGPLTKTIRDNAMLMNGLLGNEIYSQLIGESIHRLKIGVPDTFFFENVDDEIGQVVEKAIHTLEKLGANITTVHVAHLEEFSKAQKVIIAYESRLIHEDYLKRYPHMWDDEVKERLLTNAPSHDEYMEAKRIQKQSREVFNEVFSNVDVLITPTMSIHPPKINERYIGENHTDEHHIRWSITRLTSPTNLSGNPSLTLPCGLSTDGLPIGVQLIGNEYEEARLYQVGFALEQELGLTFTAVSHYP